MEAAELREFLLVRHPETLANAQGRHVARGDSAYSELGFRQAGDITGALTGWGADVLVSSPQRRALTPALVAARRANTPIRVDADLSEFDVGSVEGLTPAEAEQRGLMSGDDWLDPDAVPYQGGERVGAFQARCVAAWRRLLAEDGSRVAMVSHRGVILTIAIAALGMPADALWHLRIDPANAMLLELVEDHATLTRLGPLPDVLNGATIRPNPVGP